MDVDDRYCAVCHKSIYDVTIPSISVTYWHPDKLGDGNNSLLVVVCGFTHLLEWVELHTEQLPYRDVLIGDYFVYDPDNGFMPAQKELNGARIADSLIGTFVAPLPDDKLVWCYRNQSDEEG